MSRATTERKVRKKKIQVRNEFEDLIKRNKTLLIADLYKASAQLLNEIRRRQHDLGFHIKGGKNRVLETVLKKSYPQIFEGLKNQLEGPNIFIFSNMNPFKLSLDIQRLEVDLPASTGDIATSDIVVSEGNTGFPPGPIISLFSEAKIPTRIMSGSVYVTKDTVVASKGDVIPSSVANILGRLGLKPIKTRLTLKSAYDVEANTLIPSDLLIIKVEEYVKKLKEATYNAIKIGLEISYPSSVLMPIIISKAYSQAKRLAVEAGYVAPDTLLDLVLRGLAEAQTLQRELGKQPS
ncbi:MAG: 50S ribosomal protein L10 [Nitrososphaeria archaeon]|nr:50S ribosomal protein L10 [Nitrososphaeria archaeon]NIN53270.1 50S ribosomal protein L10 [Nitrososphaeria archaeon]NIQ33721.1 50S ribosomal protein L10 [Nitrososphaeria archaeon]